MTRPIDLLKENRKDELWQMCCGFIDLSLEQFMDIQKRLLMEQIELLKNCELGRKVMHGAMPTTVEEFREQVPLTTYADYLPELAEKREDVLPSKTAWWVRTSGKTGTYNVKWVPMSEDFTTEYEKLAVGCVLLGICREKGDTSRVKEHMKYMYTVGPPDYASGFLASLVQEGLNLDTLPGSTGEMSFQDKIKAGFNEALYRGLDGFGGIPSVLVSVGEQIKQQSGRAKVRPLLSHPGALLRVTRGLAKSKLARRPLLPRDLWSIKTVLGGGADCGIFKGRVEEMWGSPVLEMYDSTEQGLCAIQTWDYEGMTFVPNLNFFEFISEREWFKSQLDHSYQPKTILLDEVEAGENYEIVVTNLHGGIMTRYRIGDMIKITSRRNDKLGIDIPQMLFERRADELIDITGFGHITEKLVWQALENSGIPYVDWVARKEIVLDKPALHLYLELKDNYIASEQAIAATIYDEFIKLDSTYDYNIYRAYGDPEKVLGSKPIEVTLLPRGAFASYISQRQAEGAPLGHLKPPHINPTDKALAQLGSPKVVVEAAPATRTERAAVH